MNGEAGDHDQISVYADQAGLNPVFVPDDNAARNRKRAVEPGLHQEAAVFFDIQADVAVPVHLRVYLDFKGGAVTVACGDHKADRSLFPAAGFFRDPERDDGRPSPDSKISSAFTKVPCRGLVQFLVTLIKENAFNRIYRMVRSGAVI